MRYGLQMGIHAHTEHGEDRGLPARSQRVLRQHGGPLRMQSHHAQNVKERKLASADPLNHPQCCFNLTYFNRRDMIVRAVTKHLPTWRPDKDCTVVNPS